MATCRIGSLAEFHELVAGYAGPIECFLVEEDTPLDNARDLWRAVSDEGGDGTVKNPDLLMMKIEAREFVLQKLRQLERWRTHVDKKLGKLDGVLLELQGVLDAGETNLLQGYEPQVFDRVNSDQFIKDEDLAEHVKMMKALMLDEVPRSPGPQDGGSYYSATECEYRQRLEQESITEFNMAFLQLKRDAMHNMRQQILEGAENLARRFLSEPTNLGCSTADFVAFKDVAMYTGELKGE